MNHRERQWHPGKLLQTVVAAATLAVAVPQAGAQGNCMEAEKRYCFAADGTIKVPAGTPANMPICPSACTGIVKGTAGACSTVDQLDFCVSPTGGVTLTKICTKDCTDIMKGTPQAVVTALTAGASKAEKACTGLAAGAACTVDTTAGTCQKPAAGTANLVCQSAATTTGTDCKTLATGARCTAANGQPGTCVEQNKVKQCKLDQTAGTTGGPERTPTPPAAAPATDFFTCRSSAKVGDSCTGASGDVWQRIK